MSAPEDAASSLELFKGTAIEPIAPVPRRDYLTGIVIGAAMFAVGVQVVHSIVNVGIAPDWAAYIPRRSALYMVVTSPAWRIASPLVLASGVVVAHVASRGRRWPALAALVLALATVGVTFYGARSPMGLLSDEIRSE